MYGRRKTSKTGRAGSRESDETSRRSQNLARARDRSIRWSVRAVASVEIEGGYIGSADTERGETRVHISARTRAASRAPPRRNAAPNYISSLTNATHPPESIKEPGDRKPRSERLPFLLLTREQRDRLSF